MTCTGTVFCQCLTKDQAPLQAFTPTEGIILTQRTGYSCDEEAESQIRKSEVTKKPAPAESQQQAGGAKGTGSTSPAESRNQTGLVQPKLKTWTRWILR